MKHHYSSEEIEKFAIRVISKSYDKSYADFIWHNKEDNFDFTSKNNEIALEVTSIMCDNIKNAIEYDKALDKNKKPDTKFSKLFLITSRNFFVIENDIIKEYKRII